MEKVQQVHKRTEMDSNRRTVIHWLKDDEFSNNDNKILEKVSHCIKKRFDGKPVYNEKYIMKVKSIHNFIIMGCQKKLLILFVYQ